MQNHEVTVGRVLAASCGLFGLIFAVWGISIAIGAGCKVYDVWAAHKEGEAEYAKAQSTRQIKVLESIANLEAAKNHANSEIERAKGMAEANRIVGDSLTSNENYLKYLWIQAMHDTAGQVIYVPTEAGLPILESGKRR